MKTDDDSHGGGGDKIAPASIEDIPQELLNHDNWLIAKLSSGRKPPVKPRDPTATDEGLEFTEALRLLSDPTRDEAIQNNLGSEETLVLGFMLSSNDSFVMIDWDNVRDPTVGDESVPEVVQEWISELGTYSEVSPSETGLKQLLLAESGIRERLEKTGHKGELGLDSVGDLDESPKVEIYSEKHYTTVTGHLFTHPTTGCQFDSLSTEEHLIYDLIDEYLSSPTGKSTSDIYNETNPGSAKTVSSSRITNLGKKSASGYTDDREEISGEWIEIEGNPTVDQVWATGFALDDDFKHLWNGNIGKYATVSEADHSLVSKLWYYCDDWKLVEDAFRKSGLYGIRIRQPDVSNWTKSFPKWDQRSYQESTMRSTEDNRNPPHKGRYLTPKEVPF